LNFALLCFMRAVIQRVVAASVIVEEKVVGFIGHGLVVLVGIEDADTEDDAAWLAAKIVALRIFNDGSGLMNLSAREARGGILAVSQFTLFASTKKGNRPGFSRAAKPERAIPLYEYFVKQLEQELGKKVETGVFGADMVVHIVNDGPVTIVIDTKNKE
jgi:D-tyrosyl-tRNA(Tyr) deacylase